MLLKLDSGITIEDRWGHPPERVEELRKLLANGVQAAADSQRENFFEIQHDLHVFYIHLTPGGKVLLLAIWPAESGTLVACQSTARAATGPVI